VVFLSLLAPKYLYDARGFDIKAVGTFAWIPPAAAGIGCLVGGWFSSWLLQRHVPLNHARKIALGASAIIMPLILFVPGVSAAWAIALFSVAYFGQQSWSTLVMILPTDIFPKSNVGAVAGLVGFGGAMGGVVFGQLVGYLLDNGYGWRGSCARGLVSRRLRLRLFVRRFLIRSLSLPDNKLTAQAAQCESMKRMTIRRFWTLVSRHAGWSLLFLFFIQAVEPASPSLFPSALTPRKPRAN
jgi:MFS family permease